MKELDQATAALKSSAKVLREKDRFSKPINGYRDRMYNLEMPNGHIVEIQLHLDSIMKLKKWQRSCALRTTKGNRGESKGCRTEING